MSKEHQLLKLGKGEAKQDKRNFLFGALIRKKLDLPKEYDFDTNHPQVPRPMFANDEYGCCVISGRAHQTLRFELLETGIVPKITDNDVIKEYLKQTGGPDVGLIVLDSLNLWRKQGWKVAKRNYKIKAFAQVNPKDRNSIKQAIYMDVGLGIGLNLPWSAAIEFNVGKPWSVTTGRNSKPNSWGGHYVYLCGYTSAGPVCITWGQKQVMSWRFFEKYCDECYVIFDALNTSKIRKALNILKLEDMLDKISA